MVEVRPDGFLDVLSQTGQPRFGQGFGRRPDRRRHVAEHAPVLLE
jgi:hypothetical protein